MRGSPNWRAGAHSLAPLTTRRRAPPSRSSPPPRPITPSHYSPSPRPTTTGSLTAWTPPSASRSSSTAVGPSRLTPAPPAPASRPPTAPSSRQASSEYTSKPRTQFRPIYVKPWSLPLRPPTLRSGIRSPFRLLSHHFAAQSTIWISQQSIRSSAPLGRFSPAFARSKTMPSTSISSTASIALLPLYWMFSCLPPVNFRINFRSAISVRFLSPLAYAARYCIRSSPSTCLNSRKTTWASGQWSFSSCSPPPIRHLKR